MKELLSSALPIEAIAASRGYKLVSEDEYMRNVPYSLLMQNAKSLPSDDPTRKRLEAEAEISMQYAETPRIELTERDFKSEAFLASLSHVCKVMRTELQQLNKLGRLDRKTVIAKMWLANEIEEHYIKVQGAFVHFKKSDLSVAKRKIVKILFNDAIEHYRRQRNRKARDNYKVRKIKKQLAAEGITDIKVKKI